MAPDESQSLDDILVPVVFQWRNEADVPDPHIDTSPVLVDWSMAEQRWADAVGITLHSPRWAVLDDDISF